MAELSKNQNKLVKTYLEEVEQDNPAPKRDHTSQDKYNEENTRLFSIRLNFKTDKDILEELEGKRPQTEMKRLMRQGLAYQQGVKIPVPKKLFKKTDSEEDTDDSEVPEDGSTV